MTETKDEETITITLLDREVVLREIGEQHWISDCNTVSVRKYPDTSWRVVFSLCAVRVCEYGDSLSGAIAAVDTQLRALRGWLAPTDPHAQTVASDAISLLQELERKARKQLRGEYDAEKLAEDIIIGNASRCHDVGMLYGDGRCLCPKRKEGE